MPTYEVSALIYGKKRTRTHLAFRSITAAQKYVDETLKYYPNSRPRVVQGAKK